MPNQLLETLPVLIVEDDVPTAKLMKHCLEEEGFRTRWAGTAKEAREALQKEQFSVVLMDYRLPDVVSWDFLETATRLAPLTPVVVATGMGSEPLAAEAIRRGASGYIIKSMDFPDHLPQLIEPALRDAVNRRKNAILTSLVENAGDAIVAVALDDGRVLSWNTGAERLYGYKREEVLGKLALNFTPPGGTDPWADVLKRLHAGESPIHFESERIRRDGHRFPAQITVSPILDNSGKISGISIFARDLTGKKETERRALEAEARLHEIVTSSPSVLYSLRGVAPGELDVDWLSENVTSVTGFPYEQAMTRGWWRANVHPDDLERALAAKAEFQRSDRVIREYRFRSKDGSYHWFRDDMRATFGPNREIVRVVGSLSDITERKLLEDQFHQSQKMEAIGRLAGGIAHDFNNLLSIILGYSELATVKLDPAHPIHPKIVAIHKSAESAANLTKQLLMFSRKQHIELKAVDLVQTVAAVETMLTRLIRDDIELVTHFPEGPIYAKVGEGQMGQILLNLVVNARDAMPDGGKLAIEMRARDAGHETPERIPPGEWIEIAVRDTGTGMDETVQRHLFEPFFTTKDKGNGSGLGLATVYAIVEMMGGHLHVESALGEGSTFRIFLPVTAERPQPEKAITAAAGGSETVLVVDDAQPLLLLAREVLTSSGYNVLTAGSGAEALAMTGSNGAPIDLLITDVIMPGMNGKDLADKMVSGGARTKVLFISGYTADAIGRHGVLDPGIHYLPKPFTPDALARKVRETLDS